MTDVGKKFSSFLVLLVGVSHVPSDLFWWEDASIAFRDFDRCSMGIS